MSRKLIQLLGAAMLLFMVSNCVAYQIGNPSALWYTLFYNKGKSTFSANGYEPSDAEGESCLRSILMIAAFGDASINAAADKASIKKIRSVTHEFHNNYFGFYTMCTIVRGTR